MPDHEKTGVAQRPREIKSAKPVELWIRTRGLNGDDFRLESEHLDASYAVDIFKEHAEEGSGTDLDCVVAVYDAWSPIPLKGAVRFHVAEPYQVLGKRITPLAGSHMKAATRVALVLYDAAKAS